MSTNWTEWLVQVLKQPLTHRWLVAGPLALIASLAVMAAMPHWVPAGSGRVDNLVFPVLGFPLIWSVFFFYACLADRPSFAAGILSAVIALQAAIIAISLSLPG